ncbi:hypothetical protein EMCRGX_G032871 [Ephydatia muelleri]
MVTLTESVGNLTKQMEVLTDAMKLLVELQSAMKGNTSNPVIDCIVEKFGQQAYTEHGTQIKDKSNQKCRDKAKKLQTTVKPESEVAHS